MEKPKCDNCSSLDSVWDMDGDVRITLTDTDGTILDMLTLCQGCASQVKISKTLKSFTFTEFE